MNSKIQYICATILKCNNPEVQPFQSATNLKRNDSDNPEAKQSWSAMSLKCNNPEGQRPWRGIIPKRKDPKRAMILKLNDPEVQRLRSAMIPIPKHNVPKTQWYQSATISKNNNPRLQQSHIATIPTYNHSKVRSQIATIPKSYNPDPRVQPSQRNDPKDVQWTKSATCLQEFT